MSLNPPSNILIVEDSDDDFFVTQRAFEKAGFKNMIIRCKTGDETLDYLFHRGVFADSKPPIPDIILLDLNMPGTDGREVLRVLKNDSQRKKIPVVILTTSDADSDVENCYAEGANSYIKKPVDMQSFVDAICRLEDYWFHITVLPKEVDLS